MNHCNYLIIIIFYFSGFFHEHSRTDRSRFIEVDMNAIYEYESKYNWNGRISKHYQTCNTTGCKHFNFFDLESIMMYEATLPGTNITVIKPKVSCDGKECVIGQRKGLSFLDRKDIASAYDCSKYQTK